MQSGLNFLLQEAIEARLFRRKVAGGGAGWGRGLVALLGLPKRATKPRPQPAPPVPNGSPNGTPAQTVKKRKGACDDLLRRR